MARLWLGVCVPTLIACGGGPQPETASASAACPAPPSLSATPAQPNPLSTLSARLRVPRGVMEDVSRELLPKRVAEGRAVPAGVAGRVSFQIERDEPRLEITSRAIAVDVDLHGEIRLCKPFGPVCVEYGSCRPEWHARLSIGLPWQLREEPEVRLDVDVTRGCVLSPVKVDATRELEKVTREEVTKIRTQVSRAIRKYHGQLLSRVGGLTTEALGVPHFDVRVDEVGIAWDDSNTDHHVDVRVTGIATASHEQNEPERRHRESRSASLSVASDARLVALEGAPPSTRLVLSERVPFTELENHWASRSNAKVQVHAAGNQLLVEVSPWKNCGTGWALLRAQSSAGHVDLAVTQTSHDVLTHAFPAPESLTERALTQLESLRQLNALLPESVSFDVPGSRPLRLRWSPDLDTTQTVTNEPDALRISSESSGPIEATLTR